MPHCWKSHVAAQMCLFINIFIYDLVSVGVWILIDFSLTVNAVTLIFKSGRCSASSSVKQEKSGIYNLVKN